MLLYGINPTVKAVVMSVILSSRRDDRAEGRRTFASLSAGSSRPSKILGADESAARDLGKQSLEGQSFLD